jgi:hypothetical protein
MNRDEEQIRQLLNNHGLQPERFSSQEKNRGKTPDFRVVKDKDLRFFCEVKSIEKDRWFEMQRQDAGSGVIFGGGRNDPIYNRLTADIHTAIKQFDAVNKGVQYPNVLAFVNHDDMCGFQDLIAVLAGRAFTESGQALPIFQKFSEGRIREEKERVHLFIWLDDFKPERLLFSQTDLNHHQALCKLFGQNPAQIKQINF